MSVTMQRLNTEDGDFVYSFFDASPGTDKTPFIAPFDLVVKRVYYAHSVAGGASAALMLEKLTSGTAVASGTDMLASALDGTASANVTQTAVLSGTAANLNVSQGQRIGLDYSGTTGSWAGVTLTIVYQKA